MWNITKFENISDENIYYIIQQILIDATIFEHKISAKWSQSLTLYISFYYIS